MDGLGPWIRSGGCEDLSEGSGLPGELLACAAVRCGLSSPASSARDSYPIRGSASARCTPPLAVGPYRAWEVRGRAARSLPRSTAATTRTRPSWWSIRFLDHGDGEAWFQVISVVNDHQGRCRRRNCCHDPGRAGGGAVLARRAVVGCRACGGCRQAWLRSSEIAPAIPVSSRLPAPSRGRRAACAAEQRGCPPPYLGSGAGGPGEPSPLVRSLRQRPATRTSRPMGASSALMISGSWSRTVTPSPSVPASRTACEPMPPSRSPSHH